MYDTYRQAKRNAQATNWRIGAHVADLHIPDDTPIAYEGPSPTGHWNLYDIDPLFLLNCVVRVVHAPTTQA